MIYQWIEKTWELTQDFLANIIWRISAHREPHLPKGPASESLLDDMTVHTDMEV